MVYRNFCFRYTFTKKWAHLYHSKSRISAEPSSSCSIFAWYEIQLHSGLRRIPAYHQRSWNALCAKFQLCLCLSYWWSENNTETYRIKLGRINSSAFIFSTECVIDHCVISLILTLWWHFLSSMSILVRVLDIYWHFFASVFLYLQHITNFTFDIAWFAFSHIMKHIIDCYFR